MSVCLCGLHHLQRIYGRIHSDANIGRFVSAAVLVRFVWSCNILLSDSLRAVCIGLVSLTVSFCDPLAVSLAVIARL